METLTLDESQRDAIGSVLARCPLFRALKPEHIPQVLQCAEVVRFEPEEVVLRQGDASNSFLVLLEGEAAVRVQSGGREPVEIGRVPRPASIGEIGLLLDQPRTATVVAAGELTALRFSARVFHQMFQQVPNFGVGLSAGLAYRLEQVSGRVPLPEFDLAQQPPAAEALALLPVELCQRHRVLALRVDGRVLTLGHVDDPTSQVILAVREHVPGLDVQSVHVELGAFNQVMRARGGAQGWMQEGHVGEPAALAPLLIRCSPRLDAMLRRVVAEGASDLHLSAGLRGPAGASTATCRRSPTPRRSGPEDALELLEPVMRGAPPAGVREPARRRLRLRDPGPRPLPRQPVPRPQRLRRRAAPDPRPDPRHSSSSACRRRSRDLCDDPEGAGAGDRPDRLRQVDHAGGAGRPHQQDPQRAHIVTIEDPIEFVHAHAAGPGQPARGRRPHRSFARALRAALREDPDVILVGEMRDAGDRSRSRWRPPAPATSCSPRCTRTARRRAVDRLVDQFPADQQAQVRSVAGRRPARRRGPDAVPRLAGGRVAALEVLVVNAAVGEPDPRGQDRPDPGHDAGRARRSACRC